ncbi:MATE family efflux transporter [Frateuria defendens]|uniref:MATE family efflux transporter n=1 Tax=Frateuria defendens TaxID=2219559 RepID=UPI00066FF0FE|nr:MATE family efflux transporter [Frateuria defendens]
MTTPPAGRPAPLTEGPVARILLRFTLPVLGGTVLQSLNASVNAMWIGHYLGEAALTATSNATLILFLLLSAVFGVSMAATILVGQSLGARDLAQARRVVGTGAGFFLAISAALAVTGFFATGWLMRAMGTPADALPYATAYLRLIFLALPAMYFYNFLMMTLRGAGDARTPFLFLGLSVLLDIALNPLLMFGAGPLPGLGIAGSALATLVAQSVALAALLLTLHRRRHFLWIGRRELALFKPDWTLLRALVSKGLPMGLQMMVISASAILMMRLVNDHGSQTVAAYGAAQQLWNYVMMPAMAVGGAVSSIAAQNVGARRWDRVGQVARWGVVYSLLLGGALIGAIYLFNHAALALFLPADGAAIAQAAHLNAIAVWSFLFLGVTFVLFGVVRATGAVWPPLLILLVSTWFIRPPFALLLQAKLGTDAIWWSFPLGALVSMLLALGYYRYGGWRQARMLPSAAAPATGDAAAEAGVAAAAESP